MMNVELPFLGRGAANFATSAAQVSLVTDVGRIGPYAKQGFIVTPFGSEIAPLGVSFDGTATLGVSFYYYLDARTWDAVEEVIFFSEGVKKYAFGRRDSVFVLLEWSGGVWVSVGTCCVVLAYERLRFDLRFSSGSFSCSVNEVSLPSITVPTVSFDAMVIDGLYTTYSGLIIDTQSTIGCINEERQIAGIGDMTGWLGPTSNVSELGVTDATAIKAQNAGQTRSFDLSASNTDLELTHVPSMVAVSARAATGETETVRELIIGTSDGVNIDDTTDPETLGVSITPIVRNFSTDWNGLSWTSTSLVELQPIVKV